MGIGSMRKRWLSDLKIKIFADGADKKGMVAYSQNALIKGFTTNPTLMRKAGIIDYKAFALDVLSIIKKHPISFEVFSDHFDEMLEQALLIAGWGSNVYVKIPVTNSLGEPSYHFIRQLASMGVKQNVTALMTLSQVEEVVKALSQGPSAFISVFAGRIADTGRDPVPFMKKALSLLSPYKHLELIWASPRELLNILQANKIGCHIITVTDELLKKIPLLGKDLQDYSLETVKMFRDDAVKAGFCLTPLKIESIKA